jgi:hypothetical protein
LYGCGWAGEALTEIVIDPSLLVQVEAGDEVTKLITGGATMLKFWLRVDEPQVLEAVKVTGSVTPPVG